MKPQNRRCPCSRTGQKTFAPGTHSTLANQSGGHGQEELATNTAWRTGTKTGEPHFQKT